MIGHVPPKQKRPLRRLIIVLLSLLGAVIAAGFLLTDATPTVPARGAPLAHEVAAGRDAYRRLREAQGRAGGTAVTLSPEHLAGVGALVSHGFRPDRLRLATVGTTFHIDASHRLSLGRWLNVGLRAEAPSKRFPAARLRIGKASLPPMLTQWALQAARLYIVRRAVGVPPLEQAVRNFSIKDGRLSAIVELPGRTGMVDQMTGVVARDIDGPTVLRIFCSLAAKQREQPSGAFSEQLRRAFSNPTGGVTADRFNAAAFVALGMFVVDVRVADLANLSNTDFDQCAKRSVATSIYGRADWPKHWALSAAIAVSSGSQLSEAVGEWKELADSLSRRSQFAIGDPTGFSMSDIAADRAGFRAARLSISPPDAARLRFLLLRSTDEQLLPRQLVELDESMGNAEFVERYGGLDDPRFEDRVRQMDSELDRTVLR